MSKYKVELIRVASGPHALVLYNYSWGVEESTGGIVQEGDKVLVLQVAYSGLSCWHHIWPHTQQGFTHKNNQE